ncbi:MAG TPA: ACP S-malonyltransferase [Gemmatimonadaceae bacterium]|nr:ACP S-malonyltransferase [Gemmatimonadaceae bacterium]
MDVVLLFPGQGSQKPGMGRDLAEAYPAARNVFAAVDAAIGAPISRLAFEGPEADLTMTDNAQPALLAHGAAVWAVLCTSLAGHVRAAAGHSLGEITAYHVAGALALGDAARLVRQRGELMRRTGDERPGAMAAILGTLSEPVDAICARATAEAGTVVPANYNSPEQTVISGEVAGVERAMALAKEHGAKRAMRLPVSGAFHSPLMEPAAEGFRAALDTAPFTQAGVPIYGNVDGRPTTSAADARDRLSRQLTSPVRWVDVVLGLADKHPNALFVEMGPGAVLTGLAKRIAPQLATMSCGTPSDVDQLLTRLT